MIFKHTKIKEQTMTETEFRGNQLNKYLDGESHLEKDQQEAYEELDYDMERLRQAIRHIADCYADKSVTYDFLLSKVKEYL